MERLNSIEQLQALEQRMSADRDPSLPVIVISMARSPIAAAMVGKTIRPRH
jgi:hypothetical protein